MINTSEIIQQLQRRHASGWDCETPLKETVAAWTDGSVADEMSLYDSVGAELARRYFEKRYSFDFCDAVVNKLYVLVIAKQVRNPTPPWPKLFWRVFEAFDAGEFHRSADKSDDPVANFTDPEVAEIIRDLDRN